MDVTLEQIHSFQDDAFETEEAFWEALTTRRWAFLNDAEGNYTPMHPSSLPRTFELGGFHNDVYRSLAGFAREHGLIKRGKTLDEKAFFEFHWAYFFRVFAVGLQMCKTNVETKPESTRLLESVARFRFDT